MRDPRAVLNSRKFRDWCVSTPHCIEPHYLCQDDFKDFQAASTLEKRYPRNFKSIRYEELVINMTKAVTELLYFIDGTTELNTTTKKKIELESSPKTVLKVLGQEIKESPLFAMNKWRYLMDFDEIIQIQKNCTKAFRVWRYREVTKRYDLVSKDLVIPWKIPRNIAEKLTEQFTQNTPNLLISGINSSLSSGVPPARSARQSQIRPL